MTGEVDVIRRVEAEEREKRKAEAATSSRAPSIDRNPTARPRSKDPARGVNAQGMQLLDQDEADAMKPVDALMAEMVEGSQSGTVGAAPVLQQPYPPQAHGAPVLSAPPLPQGKQTEQKQQQRQQEVQRGSSKTKSGTSGGSKKR